MKTSIRLALFLLLTACSSCLFALPNDLSSAPVVTSALSDMGYQHSFPDDDHHHHDDPFDRHHHHDEPFDHHDDEPFYHHHHDHDYPYDHHRDLPYGSYKKSCSHCYVDHSVLSCVCDDRNQFPQNTSLNLYHCYRHNLDVVNDDGQLVCGREVTEQSALNEINLFLKIN